MTDPEKPKASDYEVGYGRPPKKSQFKPGQSGNPRGRPKRKKTVGELVEREFARKVAITEGGAEKRVTKLELLIRRLTNDAIKGSNPSAKLLIDLLAAEQDSEAALSDGPDLTVLDAEDQALLARHLQPDPD